MARTVLFARIMVQNNDIQYFQFIDADEAIATIQRANPGEQVLAMALVNGNFQTAPVRLSANAPTVVGEVRQYDLVVGAQNTVVGQGTVVVGTP